MPCITENNPNSCHDLTLNPTGNHWPRTTLLRFPYIAIELNSSCNDGDYLFYLTTQNFWIQVIQRLWGNSSSEDNFNRLFKEAESIFTNI